MKEKESSKGILIFAVIVLMMIVGSWFVWLYGWNNGGKEGYYAEEKCYEDFGKERCDEYNQKFIGGVRKTDGNVVFNCEGEIGIIKRCFTEEQQEMCEEIKKYTKDKVKLEKD